MSKQYRIVFECYESSSDDGAPLSSTVITSGSIERPVDIFNFGFSHEDQIKILQGSQDSLLQEQTLLYRNEFKNWIFGCAKATQFIDHK